MSKTQKLSIISILVNNLRNVDHIILATWLGSFSRQVFGRCDLRVPVVETLCLVPCWVLGLRSAPRVLTHGLRCHHFVASGTHLGVALHLGVWPAQNFPTGYIPALALQGPTISDLALALDGSEHLLHAARGIRAEATEVGGVLSHRGALSLPHPLGKLLGVI